MTWRYAGGVTTAPTVTTANSGLGGIIVQGYDGTSFVGAGSLRAVAEEAWSTLARGSGWVIRVGVTGTTSEADIAKFTGAGNFGIGTTSPVARLHALTSVNGDAFRVDATTGSTASQTTARPAFNIHSTGATAKIGFWTTVGSTRPSVYTVGAATTIRTLATTVSSQTSTGATALNVLLRALTSQFNVLAGAVKTMAMDFDGYGLLATT